MEITPPSDLEICLSIDFAPLGPRDCPRATPRASGCKINASANLSVLGGRNFHYTPPIVSVILHYNNARSISEQRSWRQVPQGR